MEKHTLQNFPVDSLSGRYNDFQDRFTWLMTTGEGTEEINYSENVSLITGYEPDELKGIRGKWHNLINEEDLETVRVKFNELLNKPLVNTYVCDYRISGKNNNIIWLRESVVADKLPSGKLKTAFGIIQDISDTSGYELFQR